MSISDCLEIMLMFGMFLLALLTYIDNQHK
ncbi:putative holin-like toxin [Pediococcus stilesii]|uniref:Putative holin-like toxin n=1 Tax=Pediococcus stilesii TaxID=331679 RepID=A0A5R9BRP8_9LACO|nr:putative holin-like toxin [Pediococcus stilesii]